MKYGFLGFLLGCSLLAYTNDILFEHLTTNDGLSNNLVRAIAQDQEGYLWFATSGGLNRYDGHSFDIYKTIEGDPYSLSESRLSNIFQDQKGFIWVRSSLGNMHRIDPSQHRVLNFQEQGFLPQGTHVLDQHITKRGDIWLILNTGLLQVSYPNGKDNDFETRYFDHRNLLPDNTIHFVYEDRRNILWVGTDKGLVRFEFSKDHPEFSSQTFFASEEVPFLCVGEFGEFLYFGTGTKKLLVYEPQDKTFLTLDWSSKLRGNISSMESNDQQAILLGTAMGDVVLYEPAQEKHTYFQRSDNGQLDARLISNIYSDSYGTFWLITEKRGIYHFDPHEKAFRYYDLNASNRIFLGEPDKQIVLEDSNRDLWIGINGGGLFLFDRKTNQFRQYNHDPNHSGSLSSDIILSLYEDRSKNLWIGTSYGGVNKISLKKEQIRRITPVDSPKTGFDNYIRSITTDVLGNIWVGTKAGKIFVYRGEKKYGSIPDDMDQAGNFPATNVYCLFFDNEHNLWIGSKGNGIYVIRSLLNYINDLGNKRIEVVHFVHEPGNNNSLISNDVYSIKQDVHGQFWIGMLNGGLNLLTDPFRNPVFQQIFKDEGKESGIVSNEVRDLFFDKQQNLWIATSEGVSILGNKYLKADKRKFINLQASITDPNSMMGKVVYQIRQAQSNDIYLATLDGGVNQLKANDFRQGVFRWSHQNSPILSTNVYCMEEDNEENIWLGTDNGLYRLNPASGIVEKYRIRSSLVPLTFSENCSGKTLKQELVFGSSNGFILFHPDSIKKDTTQYPIKFSRLEINGERISSRNSGILKQSIESQKEIRLMHSQNNISLYFSVLDYVEPEAIQYSSYLEGYDNFWSTPSTSNSAHYRKLPPGSYLLKVKATNSSGAWIRKPAELSINIRPPFWRSTAGYILIILIVSSLVTFVTIALYRQILFQNRIKIEKAINEKRMEYYTNISHEFKTPLSLILNPVEEIIMSHKSSDFAREKGMQIKRNAIYLKRLIEQILDFRKIREGKMPLNVAEVNIIEFFREIYLVFLPLAQRMGILFEYDDRPDSYMGYIDIRQLEKITYNLLSNAFRFTPKGKHVFLKVAIDEAAGLLKLEVEDEGVGIEEQELSKIFDRFYNSKNSSGIGLFYTRELVILHKGEITAGNNRKGGATFTVVLPVDKNSYPEKERIQNASAPLAFDLNSISDIETIVTSEIQTGRIHSHHVGHLERVLIVEDNRELRNYLSSELSVMYKVLEAKNGEEGVELARKELPALILSDVQMPGMDGYQLTRILKNDFNTSHIPIVLLTAESSEVNMLMGTECGADDFIMKPFQLNYLLARIEQTILQRKKLKERFERDLAENNRSLNQSPKTESGFLDQVQKWINANMANPNLNVDFLVAQMNISRTLFFKKMKAASGYAPNEYLRMVKMKEAARLLKTSDQTVSEIGMAVGFSDSNYFGKTFKKFYGTTPSEFRSESQNKQYL